MKLGQQNIQQNIPREIFFFENYAKNEAWKLVPDYFLFFKKALYQLKASGLLLDFIIFRQHSNQHAIETNCLKLYTIDPEICSILIFQIRVWEQFLQLILCMIFQPKYFSCYILLAEQISYIWLSLLLEILGNMSIEIVYYPGCDVMDFEINLIFLIEPFFYMT